MTFYISPVPPYLRRAVLRRDKHRCQKCGATKHLTLHHKVPRREGGGDGKDNLMVLCRECHVEWHRMEQLKRDVAFGQWIKTG